MWDRGNESFKLLFHGKPNHSVLETISSRLVGQSTVFSSLKHLSRASVVISVCEYLQVIRRRFFCVTAPVQHVLERLYFSAVKCSMVLPESMVDISGTDIKILSSKCVLTYS